MKRSQWSLIGLFVVCSLAAFFACNKYKDSTPVDGSSTEKTVTTSIQGRVLDDTGTPLAGARVSCGGRDTVTDVNGAFRFSAVQTSNRYGFVKASANGFFGGSRSVVASEGGNNYVTISLMSRAVKGAFSAGSGGKVAIKDGDSVAFDASAVVVAAGGAAYNGSVHVYAAYLDPTDTRVSQRMPGDLRGIGRDGKEVALQSFGMIAVELEGDAGEKLQVAAGKKATITMTIPASLSGTAPAAIPLWYFNDTTGRWIEEGSATRIGDRYVGQVGHFSWWNCDYGQPMVNFKVRVKDLHGDPLVHALLQFTAVGWGTRQAYSDSTGFAQGMIPQGVTLTFEVVNACGTVLAGQQVGPTLTDQDMGTITIDMKVRTATMKGTVVNCNGAPLTSGYVSIYVEGQNYRVNVSNGRFSIDVRLCSDAAVDAQVFVVDAGSAQMGTGSTFSITAGVKDLGELKACGVNALQTMHFTVGNDVYDFQDPPDTLAMLRDDTATWIIGIHGPASNRALIMHFPRLTHTGDIPLSWLEAYIDGRAYYIVPYTYSAHITKYGGLYEDVEGSFNCMTMLQGDTTVKLPVAGNFKVKRTF